MKRTVKIGDADFEMQADAFTPIHYYQIFKEDLMRATEGMKDESVFSTETYLIYTKLAFVMTSRAAKSDMDALTPEDFEKWAEGIEFIDMCNALADVANIYTASKVGSAKPKK